MLSSWQRLASLTVLLAALLAASLGQAQAGTFAQISVRTDAGITAEADYLSGRSLTVVCAVNEKDWARSLTAVGFPAGQADNYFGFSLIPEGEMHLSPYVCTGLALGMVASTRAANAKQVAWSVDVLVHESTHMRLYSYDEALVEACARVGLPLELHRLYQVAYHSAEMRRLTAAGTALRVAEGAAYNGGTCPA